MERANKGVPTMLRYSTHAKNNSLYNTPPMFGVYVLDLVLQWIDGLGGVAGIAGRNDAKAVDASTRPSTAAAASTRGTPSQARGRG